jgi:hypothetical protein
MSNLKNHAEVELGILAKATPDAVILEFKDEIIALCDKFGNSGQSGGSAPYVAGAIKATIGKLLMFETIAPVTGEDWEWGEPSDYGDGPTYQNMRDSRIFKKGKDGKPYFIEAMIKKTQSGVTWHGWFWKSKEDYLTGNKDLKIAPKAYIKSFPFTPKTFYIDVIEEEVAPDDWEMYMVNPEQLNEVYNYYEVFNK